MPPDDEVRVHTFADWIMGIPEEDEAMQHSANAQDIPANPEGGR